MSDFKFTPGPWSLCGAERGGCSCYSVGCDDYPVARVEHGEWGDSYPEIRLVGEGIGKTAEAYMERIPYGSINEEFAKGNAYLIAAAPDMYAALKEAFVVMSGGEESNNPFDAERWAKAVIGIQTALAKAENKMSD